MEQPKFKVLEAISQEPSTLYKIPADWAIEDIVVRYGILYYKGKKKECPIYEVEGQQKYAKLEITDDYDIDEYFDCEDEDKNDSEDDSEGEDDSEDDSDE